MYHLSIFQISIGFSTQVLVERAKERIGSFGDKNWCTVTYCTLLRSHSVHDVRWAFLCSCEPSCTGIDGASQYSTVRKENGSSSELHP